MPDVQALNKAEAALAFAVAELIGPIIEERIYGPGYIAFVALEKLRGSDLAPLVAAWVEAAGVTRVAPSVDQVNSVFDDLDRTWTDWQARGALLAAREKMAELVVSDA